MLGWEVVSRVREGELGFQRFGLDDFGGKFWTASLLALDLSR